MKSIAASLLLTSGLVVRVGAAETETEKDDNNLREDVIVCEEAVAHAVECCGFEVQGDACRFHHFHSRYDCGCSGGTDGETRTDVRPVLSIDEGRRIIETSCDALTCDVLQDVLQRNNETSSSIESRCN